MATVADVFALFFTQPPVPVGDPPTGSPTNGSSQSYSSSPRKWRFLWDNDDPLAYTRIYTGPVGTAFGSTTREAVALPGATSFDTELSAPAEEEDIADPLHREVYLAHYRNGVESTPPHNFNTIEE